MSDVISESCVRQQNLMLFELLRVVNLGQGMELLSARVQQPIGGGGGHPPRQAPASNQSVEDLMNGSKAQQQQTATGNKNHERTMANRRGHRPSKLQTANRAAHLSNQQKQRQSPLGNAATGQLAVDCTRPLDLTLTRRAADESEQQVINYSTTTRTPPPPSSLFRCNRPPPIALPPIAQASNGLSLDSLQQATNSRVISSSTSPSCPSRNGGGGRGGCTTSGSDHQSPTESGPHHQVQHQQHHHHHLTSDVIISSTIASKRRRRKNKDKPSIEATTDGDNSAAAAAATSPTSRPANHGCNHCGRSFSRSDMLTRHLRLHSGLKPYQCAKCLQVFSRSDHLSTHERTHTGEKPYQCDMCAYSACRRDMITRHRRTHSESRARRWRAQTDGAKQRPARRPSGSSSSSGGSSLASRSPPSGVGENGGPNPDDQPDSLTGEHMSDMGKEEEANPPVNHHQHRSPILNQ